MQTVVFVHIPKTGGTTLGFPLRTLYGLQHSLKEFVRSDHPASGFNRQTEYISGLTAQEVASDPDAALQIAIDHLKNRFVVAGVTCYFDETITLMKERLGWSRNPYYVTSRVGKKKAKTSTTPRPPLADDLTQEIASLNHLDMQLYAYAKSAFEEEVEALGPAFEKRVQAFQKRNEQLGPFLAPPLKAVRTVRRWARRLSQGRLPRSLASRLPNLK